jgi:glutathione S-transferase
MSASSPAGPFFTGEALTFADCALFSVTSRFVALAHVRGVDVQLSSRPRLAGWCARGLLPAWALVGAAHTRARPRHSRAGWRP